MSRHSEGQHNRKLHKIVSIAGNGKLSSEAGSAGAEEPATNSVNGWQSEQGKQADSRNHQSRASNGIKPVNLKVGDSKIKKGDHFIDQHLAESSTDRGTNTHEGAGHNIERLKEVVKRRLLKPSKARKRLNTGLRVSNSVNELSSHALTSGPAGAHGSYPEWQYYRAYKAEERSHHSIHRGVSQSDHLIEELEDTREQLKRSLEDNARLQTEVNHLADELYRFKIPQMVEQNGAIMMLGTDVEISVGTPGLLTVHGMGNVLNRTSESLPVNGNAHYEHHDISITRSREALEGQLKVLQDHINKLEQLIEVHKSEYQATTAAQPSEFHTSVMKVLCDMTSVQKAIQENSKDFFAKTQVALKSKSVENDQLRRMVLEYKTEMDTLVQQMNVTMEEEWSELQEKQDQLQVERERLSQKPIMELKTQLIQLRGGYEQKITKLQEEAKKLEEDNAVLEHKYTDLRDKIDPAAEQTIAEHPSSESTELHILEMKSPGNREGRTTHLERVVNELQTMVANNEKLCKEVQRSLQARASISPPTGRERASSPSLVAMVMPISQPRNSKPQSSYLQQASVEPIIKNVSPSMSHGRNHNEQQQVYDNMEDETIREDARMADNPQTVKYELLESNDVVEKGHFDDRPFDPNFMCLGCRKQFGISEIQEYRKHYTDCLSNQSEQVIQEPKLLCRTPGCSFMGYEDLGGLCLDCSYGQENLEYIT